MATFQYVAADPSKSRACTIWYSTAAEIRCRLLKHDAARSQVAMSGVDLEIPFGPPWIKHTTLPATPTIDKRCSTVHRGVSHDGRFVVEVSKIRSEMVIQAQDTRFRQVRPSV